MQQAQLCTSPSAKRRGPMSNPRSRPSICEKLLNQMKLGAPPSLTFAPRLGDDAALAV